MKLEQLRERVGGTLSSEFFRSGRQAGLKLG